MSEQWQSVLERWSVAGLIDAPTSQRIRSFEESNQQSNLSWPTLIAIAFGATMLAAGVLLFVSAHWDELSPTARFSLVLFLVSIFHVAGALVSERFPALATGLHGVGTIACGGGIFLAAQIFNLQEHWPGGIMLWALGAWIGWGLRRDWVQAGLVAILTPAWLAAEWVDATRRFDWDSERIMAQGLLLLAITYLTAYFQDHRGNTRRCLAWIGGVALIPFAAASMPESYGGYSHPSTWLVILGRTLGMVLPLVLALWLRGKTAWINFLAALWVIVLILLPAYTYSGESLFHYSVRTLGPYIWCALASFGLIAWGLKEARRERINLGILSFGITILAFYFSSVMDKLGRSASFIGLGLLFLVLAWGLERTRRRLVASVQGVAA
jgi:uncharacterized membrane protein